MNMELLILGTAKKGWCLKSYTIHLVEVFVGRQHVFLSTLVGNTMPLESEKTRQHLDRIRTTTEQDAGAVMRALRGLPSGAWDHDKVQETAIGGLPLSQKMTHKLIILQLRGLFLAYAHVFLGDSIFVLIC